MLDLTPAKLIIKPVLSPVFSTELDITGDKIAHCKRYLNIQVSSNVLVFLLPVDGAESLLDSIMQ